MLLHETLIELLNNFSYRMIVNTLNELTTEQHRHHIINYAEMMEYNIQPSTDSNVETVEIPVVSNQMAMDILMLGSTTKAIDIKSSKRPVVVEETVSVQKALNEAAAAEATEATATATATANPKKIKKPKAKRV